MKIAIVGGCFTDQHNIPPDLLYHQLLKKRFAESGAEVQIRTIRYERIASCLEKIISLKQEFDFDLLIFHLRAEPLMRMTKLYYKFLDDDRQLKRSVNFPLLNIFYPEKFDLLLQRRINFHYPENVKESKVRHSLREANYVAGSLVGNKAFGLKVIKEALLQINIFCLAQQAALLVLGPVSRPFSRLEDNLSEEMHTYFSALAQRNSLNYLSLLGKTTALGETMFFENGIHVSQEGHYEIAGSIYNNLISSAFPVSSENKLL